MEAHFKYGDERKWAEVATEVCHGKSGKSLPYIYESV